VQELPLSRLTFPAFRRVLEHCQCRCTCLAEYGALSDVDGAGSPALYAFERGEGDVMKWAVLHVWDDTWPVPVNDIRSVCAALDIDLSIFDASN
jgi:hypothetical protein